METLKIKSVSLKDGSKIVLGNNSKGLPTASRYRVLSSGRNKGQVKQIESYYFSSEESRKNYVERAIKIVNERIEGKAEIENLKKEVRKDMKHGYEVGNILYTSWGYEQTNVDFYQVVEIKGSVISLRSINGEMVAYNSGDSGRIKPLKDQFAGEAFQKKINFYIGSDKKPHFYIKISEVASAYHYTSGENGVHCSWGY